MSLKPLSSIQAPDLISFDREGIATDIMNRMKALPGWQDIWVAEQYQDASQFIIQTFSYLFEKIANANNKVVRENFLSEAFSERAIYANLNQMRCNTIQNKAACVELVGRIEDGVITQPLPLGAQLKVKTTDTKSNSCIFEIIPKDSDGEYIYTDSVIIQPTEYAGNSFRITAYAGETKTAVNELTAYDLEHLRLNVPYTNIIDDSIQCYYRTSLGVLIKLIKTTKFVVSPYISSESQTIFPAGVPHYVIRYTSNGSAEIVFGSEAFGGAFPSSCVGGSIVTYCRIGGGSATNIPANKINFRTSIDRYGQDAFTVNFSNPSAAYGGDDAETAQQAKVYAPLRYGRDGTAILLDDAKNALYKTLVKHEISKPQFSEIANNVPLLHAFHYIVPKRTFVDWEPASYIDNETFDSYVNRLFIDLNSYLSVQGTNDRSIGNEIVHTFSSLDIDTAYDFIYDIANIKPLSNSLTLSAWDHDSELIDQISWTGNYPTLQTINSAVSTDHAILDTTNFEALYIQSGINNKIKFQLDDKPYIFILTISPGISVGIDDTINELNNQMQYLILTVDEAIDDFSAFTYYEFFRLITNTDGTKSMRISSPRTGMSSKISLLPHGQSTADTNDIYKLMNILVGTYYPPYATEKVFTSQGSTYYHNTGEIKVGINTNLITDQLYTVEWNDDWTQPTGVIKGPVFSFTLDDDQIDKTLKVIPNTDILVEAYYTDPNTLIDSLVDSFTFDGIVSNDFTYPGTGSLTVFDTNNLSDMYFDDTTSSFNIKLLDGVEATLYTQSYPVVTYMEVYKNGVLWRTLTEADCKEVGTDALNSWTQDRLSSTGKFSYLPIDFTDFLIYSGTPAGFSTSVIITRNEAGGNPVTLIGNGIKSISTLLAEYTATYSTYTFTVTGNSNQVLNNGVSITLDIPATVPYYDIICYRQINTTPYVINNFHFELISDVWVTTDTTDIGIAAAYRCIQILPAYVYADNAYKINFSFKNPDIDLVSSVYYTNGFADFSYIKITFQRQIYNYITAAYTPNPYAPTTEAATYTSILKNSETKLLGLEHIIKDISFAPVGGTLTLTIAPGYSEKNIYELANDIIETNFGYSNTNANHTIGTIITEANLRACLLKELAANYGLEDVSYTNGALYDTLETELTDMIYFFVADETLVLIIKEVEATSTALTGLSSLFEMNIVVTTRSRV